MILIIIATMVALLYYDESVFQLKDRSSSPTLFKYYREIRLSTLSQVCSNGSLPSEVMQYKSQHAATSPQSQLSF